MDQNRKHARNHTIELLRFLFAGIVVLHHSRYLFGDENCYFLGGSLAVEFFLFVSGYLLMAGVEKAGNSDALLGEETLRFIFHKMSGFLPEFLIAWWIGFAAAALLQKWNIGQIWDAFRDNFWELTLVKMSGLFTGGINGVMWYLSAMLLAMAILYPLLRKYQDMMSRIICPLLALFIYGYLCREYGHPRDPAAWNGMFYKGFLRTMAGLCSGVVICRAAAWCRRRAAHGLTAAGNFLAALVQLACLILSIRYMRLEKPSEEDYFYMFLLLLLVLLTFCGWGIASLWQQENPNAGRETLRTLLCRGADFLGKYSLPLYLGHLYFAQHINDVTALAALNKEPKMLLYVGLSLGNGAVIMALAALWRRKRRKIRAVLHSLLIL